MNKRILVALPLAGLFAGNAIAADQQAPDFSTVVPNVSAAHDFVVDAKLVWWT
ncbi:MAG: hypothetical protein LRZ85_01315 [Alphaproteobacteria bacterium]|nr:hypothetical protein [Alphaproteobacteria bacterium]MCD8570800.1 hypothetical protein [Alphaproteobacteria bacterium]